LGLRIIVIIIALDHVPVLILYVQQSAYAIIVVIGDVILGITFTGYAHERDIGISAHLGIYRIKSHLIDIA
jgi:hypothetical protein